MKTNLNEKIIDSYSKIGTADQATINSLITYDNNQKTQAQKKLEMLLNSGGFQLYQMLHSLDLQLIQVLM